MMRRELSKALLLSTVGAVAFSSRAQAQSCGSICYPLSAGETAPDVVASSYPPGDVRRYGAIGDGNTSRATTNSAAIQKAIDIMRVVGGGTVHIPTGVYCVNAPIKVYEKISLVGDGCTASILKKTTATASSVSDSTSRFWDGATVGSPICVLHFVNYDQVNTWAYAQVSDLG